MKDATRKEFDETRRRALQAGSQVRQFIFDANVEQFTEMASQAVNAKKYVPSTVAIVAVHPKNSTWTRFGLIESFVSDCDCQLCRNQDGSSISYGIVRIEILEGIVPVIPEMKSAFESLPPEGHLYTLILSDGGASLYAVPYTRGEGVSDGN